MKGIDSTALVFVASVLAAACSKDKAGEKASADPDPAAPEVSGAGDETEKPSGPVGTLVGKVSLAGEAPEMPSLRRGADPVCAKTQARAETVMVADGGLANVVVRILPGTAKGFVPEEPVHVDQLECMYRPRVQPGVVGQMIEVANGDATMHNVHARRLETGKRQGTDTIVNRAQPAGTKPIGIPIEEGEDVVKLKCDSHGWMQGFVVVSDNPYAAVSEAGGRYSLSLPIGEHEIQSWHEFYGTKVQKVTISEGAEATLDFSYDAAADNPMGAGSGEKDHGDEAPDAP